MGYIVLCILNVTWNCYIWIRVIDMAFNIKDTIKHPYLIGLLLSIPYFVLKAYEMVYPDNLVGIIYILGEVFVIVSRIFIINKLVDIDIKKNAIFVIFLYILYIIFKSFFVIIVMLLSVSLHYSYDILASIVSIVQAPLSYYIALKCYFHVVGKHHIYTNKYFIASFALFVISIFCEEIWQITLLFIVVMFLSFKTLHSMQNQQEKYQSSIVVQKEKDMMIKEYQEIEAEQLKLRKQKHDFLNHLYTIQILLENHQKQEALEYIEKYRERI